MKRKMRFDVITSVTRGGLTAGIRKYGGLVAALALASAVQAAEPMTLEFWDFPHMPETNAYLEKSVRTFEADNPGVKVRYTRLPWQDGQQKVTLSVLSGRPPDVCGQVSNNVSQFVAQDALEPLNTFITPELADFQPSYIDAVSHQDQIYAVPWYKTCYVALLNLDVFDAFGVTPPPHGRWTYDEFVDSLKKLTRVAPAPDTRLNPPPNAAPQPNAQYYGLVTNLGPAEYEAYSVIFNFGGRILTRDNGVIRSGVADPAFIRGLEHLQDLQWKHKVVAPSIGAFTQDQSWSLWRDSRTVAVTFQGAWCINAMNQANVSLERTNASLKAAGRVGEMRKPYRWALAAPPSIDKETTPVMGSSGLGTFVVFKQKDQRRREMAAKFALHLVRAEGQQVLRYECAYPSRISAGNPYADDPMIGPVFNIFSGGILSPLVPGAERVDRMLQQEIQKALLLDPATGQPQATAAEAAAAGHRNVEAVLQRAYRRFGKP